MTNFGRNRNPAANSGLAKVAVQYSADTFVVNQTLVLRINICGKIATFAKPQTVCDLNDNQSDYQCFKTDESRSLNDDFQE